MFLMSGTELVASYAVRLPSNKFRQKPVTSRARRACPLECGSPAGIGSRQSPQRDGTHVWFNLSLCVRPRRGPRKQLAGINHRPQGSERTGRQSQHSQSQHSLCQHWQIQLGLLKDFTTGTKQRDYKRKRTPTSGTEVLATRPAALVSHGHALDCLASVPVLVNTSATSLADKWLPIAISPDLSSLCKMSSNLASNIL